ncbi:MAG: class I SAM-dependent methyltransferase [Firmicutes bacterium]|nr:class I SAM-dependent methyltransferase [Bacillota bacterium]
MGSFDLVWEQIHQEQEWGKYPSEEVIRFIARNFYRRNRAEVRLLDLGCGTGAATWFMAREGFDVYALDGSETAVYKAEQRMRDEGLKAKIAVADAACLPYPNEFFDGVVDSAMIYAHTVENIRVILKECYRVLKKEGKLFSTGLFKIGMTGYGTGEKLEENTFRELTEGSLAHRGIAHFFTKQQIMDFWSTAGFKNMVIDSLERTDHGGAESINYYLVEAEK